MRIYEKTLFFEDSLNVHKKPGALCQLETSVNRNKLIIVVMCCVYT